MARNPNYNATSDSKFTQLQNQVDEVKDVMTNNIDSILKRGDRLEDLVDKTNELESTAIQFNSQAKKIKRKMWWKNTKMMLIIGAVIVLFIVIIAIALGVKFGGGSSSSDDKSTTTPKILRAITSDH